MYCGPIKANKPWAHNLCLNKQLYITDNMCLLPPFQVFLCNEHAKSKSKMRFYSSFAISWWENGKFATQCCSITYCITCTHRSQHIIPKLQSEPKLIFNQAKIAENWLKRSNYIHREKVSEWRTCTGFDSYFDKIEQR